MTQVQTCLTKVGLPAFKDGHRAMYCIGATAFTIGIMMLLTWVSIGLGHFIRFSSSWILFFVLLGIYNGVFKANIKLAGATALLLFVFVIISHILGSPTFVGFIIFAGLLIGGFFAQNMAHTAAKTGSNLLTQITNLLYAPLMITVYFLDKANLSHLINAKRSSKSQKKTSKKETE